MLPILDARAIKAQMLLALDHQRPRVGAEVDRIAPAALLLAADRTIAELIRNRRMAVRRKANRAAPARTRSEEHTSELQSLMRISYAVFCLKKKKSKTVKHRS